MDAGTHVVGGFLPRAGRYCHLRKGRKSMGVFNHMHKSGNDAVKGRCKARQVAATEATGL